MLLKSHNIEATQKDIVRAAHVEQRIKEHGMTVQELKKSVHVLAPELTFWHKKYATITELSQIINSQRCPVGVEWQGIFEDDEEDYNDEYEEDGDDDPGHYGIITAISTNDNFIYMIDPYKKQVHKDRKMTVLEFERRWWDINQIVHPISRRLIEVDDYHAMFIITDPKDTFPLEFNMEK